jgi:hypothetical protein
MTSHLFVFPFYDIRCQSLISPSETFGYNETFLTHISRYPAWMHRKHDCNEISTHSQARKAMREHRLRPSCSCSKCIFLAIQFSATLLEQYAKSLCARGVA